MNERGNVVHGWKATLAALLIAYGLVACGGGGGSAGTPVFGGGSGSSGGGSGGSAGGGTGGGVSDVSTGVPSQKSISISVEKYALNWSVDGDETSVSVRVTDTAGNPVPEGTVVQFSTEGGQIEKSCRLTGVTVNGSTISQCSVKFSTQNRRPPDGYVSILAWLEGEEAYVDLNGNGRHDAGEPFWDSGRLFRDDNESRAYEYGQDELNVGAAITGTTGIGSAACNSPADYSNYLNLQSVPRSEPNTCDGNWGKTLIRTWAVLPVSDPRYLRIDAVPPPAGTSGTFVLVYSQFGTRPTAAPAGTTVTVQGAPNGCTVQVSPAAVNVGAVEPTYHRLTASGTSCSGASVTVVAKFDTYEANTTLVLP